MSYKIVVDSCCEVPEECAKKANIVVVPLSLQVGDWHITDDENFNQAEFLKKVADSPECPKSACPSPDAFMQEYNCEEDRVYVVTLTSKLSGSYNSAVLAEQLYYETYGEKDIYVVDSLSASCGEAQIMMKLIDLEEQGFSFDEIVRKIEIFKNEMKTMFVLGNADFLKKNGRLTGVKAIGVSALNLRLCLAAKDGEIVLKGQGIGMKKALTKLANMLVEEVKELKEHDRLIISHCNARESAEIVKKAILDKLKFIECIIIDTRGVSSLYAADGGVIVAV